MSRTKILLTLTDVLARGWSRQLVDQLLGSPDETKHNPHYRSAAPMRLYSLARVKRAERRVAFRKYHADAERRSAVSEVRRQKARERNRKAEAQAKEQSRRAHQAEQDRLNGRYPSCLDAIPDACRALFELNRFANHRTCDRSDRTEIYLVKNEFIALLYRMGFCTAAWEHRAPRPERICRRCEGTGDLFGSGDACYECPECEYGNIPARVDIFACFRFEIAGTVYTWHQPCNLLMFQVAYTKPPETWNGEVGLRSVAIANIEEPIALLRWVIEKAKSAAKDSRHQGPEVGAISRPNEPAGEGDRPLSLQATSSRA